MNMPFADIKDYSLFYESKGSGEAVVFGHSLYCDHTLFSFHAERLSKDCQTINFDFQAHGQSGCTQADYFTLEEIANDLLHFLDDLKLEKVHWVGLSVGAMVGMRMALKQPERFRSMVLMNTAAEADAKEAQEKFLNTAKEVYFGDQEKGLDILLTRFFSPKTHKENPNLVEDWKEKIKNLKDRDGFQKMAQAVFTRKSIVNDIKKLTTPTLVIAGQDDLSKPPKENKQIADNIKGAEYTCLENTAHLSAAEHPEHTLELIKKFIETHS